MDNPPVALQLSLRIWHPNCWTLQVTDRIDAGLVGHSIYEINGEIHALMTAYADTRAILDRLETAIEKSPLTNSVQEINEFFSPYLSRAPAGNATRELFVRYPTNHSIHSPIISKGLVPDDFVRMRNGEEYWTVVTTQSRPELKDTLTAIRRTRNADIRILGMKSRPTETNNHPSTSDLSERQREVLELARRRGYYSWPRHVSATDLAEELSITKATLLEHLRKAEAKVLGPSDDQYIEVSE